MAAFLVDEDLPRSLVKALGAAGMTAHHVIDVGLRGHSDDAVLAWAVAHALAVVTADVDFGNVLRFPPGSHCGIVVSRIPSWTTNDVMNARIVGALETITDPDLAGSVVVIEPTTVRIRRPR